jgi:hypothetical protein
MRRTFIALVASLCLAAPAIAAPAASAGPAALPAAPADAPRGGYAIVATDSAVLRATPRESGQQLAQLHAGELLEVRAEKLEFLQVWDHRRERGGYVRANQVQRTSLAPHEAAALLAVLRFVRERPGHETLGIGLAAAWLRAAPADAVRGEAGAEVLESIGTLADRLAQQASNGAALAKSAQARVAAHLDVVGRYGMSFASYELESRMQVCYEGDAFRRVLATPSAEPAARARAALGLTRPECLDPAQKPLERHERNRWRADVLERADASGLPGPLKNRLHLRRAAVWSSLAYEYTRLGQAAAAQAAATRALSEFAVVRREDLAEEDAAGLNDAAMRVNAVRWAALPAMAPDHPGVRPQVVTVAGQPGETCVLLVDAKNGADKPLARRCTYALVWPQSASLNREGNALALAVQPMEAWRETWLFRRKGGSWSIDTVVPGPVSPELGYAEFAGWVPGGQQMLLAREMRGDGRYQRNYEVVSLDSLVVARQSGDPASLGPFQRWQDAAWKRQTVSLR